MNVLLLTPQPHLLKHAILKCGDDYVVSTRMPDLWPKNPDFIVSFGYRHIIKEPYLSQYKDRMFNIHISILPWNRGADPNFWSWFDDTPKGVSIHLITSGLDNGPIVAQMGIANWEPKNETLRSSYDRLLELASALFVAEWPNIRESKYNTIQKDGGSYHTLKDKDKIFEHLPLGWDTPVSNIQELGREIRKGKSSEAI